MLTVAGAAAGLTTTVTVPVASVVPTLEHVILKTCVLAGIAERSSDPPLAVLVPLQEPEASQLLGLPVVVQERVVAPGAVSGPTGLAVRLTEMAETELTTTSPQPLQLLPSFDSTIVPTMEVLLSAQNLTERVPAAPVNV